MRRIGTWLGPALAFCLLVSAPAEAKVVLKVATVAPSGSAWMRIFKKMNKKIKKATGGEVELKFYAGQVQGDERDVVRKMRTGQLHGGSFTTVGLSMINPKVLVLQNPMMFDTAAQLDKVRQAMREEFNKSFEDKGYVLLGWGDVGWVYLFSKEPISSKADLAKQKVWAWGDDPLTKALMREAGVKPRLLGLPQVYPALNTGIINAVYNAPLACLTLQWHTKVKYYTDFPLAIAIGATVIKKSEWDKISAEHQAEIRKIADKYHRKLTKRIHKDNKKALQILVKQGLQPVKVSEKAKGEFRAVARKVADNFAPRYYPKALLKKVRSLR